MKEFSRFRLDFVNQCLWARDETSVGSPAESNTKRISLTPKAFAVLRYLVEHSGRLVTQDELLNAVWPDTFVQPEALKYQIADIRAALGDRAKNSLFIETLPRRGYRFIAPVTETGSAEAAARLPASTPLVGRSVELASLRTCLCDTLKGHRQVVFITGEPGIGKTALVDEFRRRATSENPGLRVALGQCVEGYGGAEAYYPMLEALSSLCHDPESTQIVDLLATRAPTWLAQFADLVRRDHRETLHREILGASRARMLREIREALEAFTAETPLLLIFDDLQWVDPSSVDLISAIARGRLPAKLMLIGIKRPADTYNSAHPLRELRQELLLHQLCREITLQPLSESAVAEFLSPGGEALPPGLPELIYRRSEGNPLFMIAALDRMIQDRQILRENGIWELTAPIDQIEVKVPETLRQVIEAQIEHLPMSDQRALEAASVAGVSFSIVVVAAAMNADVNVVTEVFETLCQRKRIIRATAPQQLPDGRISQRFDFLHSLYREVLYWRQTPARRASMHRRMGEELDKTFSGRLREIAAELAEHFEKGGEWARAVECLRLAARTAARRLAPDEAAAIIRRAVSLAGSLPETNRALTETQLLADLARIYQACLNPLDIPTYEEVVSRAAVHQWYELEADALLDMTMSLARTTLERWRNALQRAQAVITHVQDPQSQAIMKARLLGSLAVTGGWNREAAQKFREACAEVAVEEYRLAITRGFVQSHSTEYREACECMRQTRSALAGSDSDILFCGVFHWVSMSIVPRALALLGEWGEALRENDAGIGALIGKGWSDNRTHLWSANRGWVLWHALDFAGVREHCGEVLSHGSGTSLVAWVDRLSRVLAGCAETALGSCDVAMEHFSTLQKEMSSQTLMEDWYFRLPLEAGLTDLFLAKSEPAQARLHAIRFIEEALATDERTWQALAWESLSRVALAQSDIEGAQSHVARALDSMEGFFVPVAAWRVHATAAEVFSRAGNRQPAAEHIERSRVLVMRLADSLAEYDTIRRTFLQAPAVRRVLEAPYATAPIRSENAAAIA